MHAGAAELDITPPLGLNMPGLFHERLAQTIHDPLMVRSLVMESNGSGAAIAVCDLIGIDRLLLDEAKNRIEKSTGLPPSAILISCTHTHTGTEAEEWTDYTRWMVNRIVDSVTIAWSRRVAAEVGWASASEPRLPFNRRFKMKDGTYRTNPGIGNPDIVEPGGPVDPEVGALCLRHASGSSESGKIIGLLGNYSMHYIGGGDHERAISADYFGMFAKHICQLREAPFVAALSVGASGDINNIDVKGSRRPNDRYQHTDRASVLLAAAAYWAINEMEFKCDLPIASAIEEIVLPRRPVTEEDLKRADELEKLERPTMSEAVTVWLVRRMTESPKETRTWVQALRIGALGIVAVPGELLVDLGLEIKRRSPFSMTTVIELANDNVGYVPSRQTFEEGGYEPTCSPFEPGAGEQIVETALALLGQLRSN